MTDDPRPPRRPATRPVGGSRNPVARPRKVAGRDVPSAPEEPTEELVDEPVEPVGPVGPVDEPEQAPALEDEEPTSPGRRRLFLVVAAALLAGLVGAEGWYLYGTSEPAPSAERPVVTGKVTHRSAVETAARSTTEILSYGFEDFDAQIEDATTQMTEPFAEEFRQTAADVKERFVEQRITQEVRIVASSVVTASEEEVRALLFLDQYVAKAGEGTSVTPYRAMVTVRRGDGGWLVSDIETQ